MPVIRFHDQEEAREWKNIIEHFESIISTADDENKRLKEFCAAQVQTSQFWKRYAFERTRDTKLQEIALSSLQQVEREVARVNSVVPEFLKKMLNFLKQFQPGA